METTSRPRFESGQGLVISNMRDHVHQRLDERSTSPDEKNQLIPSGSMRDRHRQMKRTSSFHLPDVKKEPMHRRNGPL
jgi:hypothetical protein